MLFAPRDGSGDVRGLGGSAHGGRRWEQRDRRPGSGRRGSALEQWRSLIMAQLKSERESALGLRSGPERERAGGERGAKDNCGDGHDVGGREARKEREREREKARFVCSLRTFRHAVERCGPGERGPCAKAASERETSGRSEGTRVLNGHTSPLSCKRRALARAGLGPESRAPQAMLLRLLLRSSSR